MNPVLEFLKNLGPKKLIGLMGVIGILGFMASMIADRMTHTPMGLLASDLHPAEAGKIVTKIESLNIPFDLKGDGTSIYVPQDHVLRLRMQLAEEGIMMTGAVVGNEIFDRTDTLGMTSFLQDIHQLRALEGELARTIMSLKPVASARVHLVMPKKSLFTQESQEPSASIVLRMKYKGRLSDAQVRAIQHMVASAVPQLNTDHVSMIDDQGTLLAQGAGNGQDADHSTTHSMEELHIRYEERLGRSIESLLERTIGAGKVKARVSIDMDYERMTENAELFDPDGQVVRSSQTSEDGTQNTEHNQQTVTIQNNLPTASKGSNTAPRTASNSKKSDETVNYEISKTIRNRIKEAGGIKRLSVAVLVDGHYDAQNNETPSYTPRSAEELEQIKKLVSSAIGYQDARGDHVDVINMKFAPSEDAQFSSNALPLGLTKSDILRLSEAVFLVLAAFVLGFFILKPFMNTLRITLAPQLKSSMAQGESTTGAAQADDTEALIPEEKIDYKIKKTNLSRIEDLIKQNPEETVSMLRNWIGGEV